MALNKREVILAHFGLKRNKSFVCASILKFSSSPTYMASRNITSPRSVSFLVMSVSHACVIRKCKLSGWTWGATDKVWEVSVCGCVKGEYRKRVGCKWQWASNSEVIFSNRGVNQQVYLTPPWHLCLWNCECEVPKRKSAAAFIRKIYLYAKLVPLR